MRKIVSWIIIVSIVGMSFAWVNILTFEGVRMSVDRLSDGNFVTVGYSNLYVFSTIQGDIIETSGDLFTVFNDTDTTDSDIFPALSAFPDEGFVYLYYHSDSSRFVVRKRSNTGGPMWSPCYFPSDESAPGVDENIYFLKDIYALTDGGCFYAGGGRLVDENQWDAMIGYIDSDGLDQ
ncbi:hypothetical protein DRQ33_04540 [bacterium]|nr:MAG: hypothetical protein DRQ33_04540 [bacterium]